MLDRDARPLTASRPAAGSPLTTWGARLAWLAVAVVGGRAIGDATAARSDPVQIVATVGAWCGWAAGAIALAVPAVATLTAVRADRPRRDRRHRRAAWRSAPTPVPASRLGVPAVVAAVLAGAAETGSAFVQASAYGDERRLLLRPPLGYLAASVVSWMVWVAAAADRAARAGRRGPGCSPASATLVGGRRRAGCSPAAGTSSAGAGW